MPTISALSATPIISQNQHNGVATLVGEAGRRRPVTTAPQQSSTRSRRRSQVQGGVPVVSVDSGAGARGGVLAARLNDVRAAVQSSRFGGVLDRREVRAAADAELAAILSLIEERLDPLLERWWSMYARAVRSRYARAVRSEGGHEFETEAEIFSDGGSHSRVGSSYAPLGRSVVPLCINRCTTHSGVWLPTEGVHA